ncbi:YwmB family TATA-box binding protein [Proteiniborus sp. MB09-C3]|uniref:YwmB family TATA-box binding protein n=1 Tax=Proteiniborus sp. MB09-C3 TaxID=3050072 RepID=UPI002556C6F5|nr:YwmB family TATA-box binding protein [Proteiniborus sp. MB09-C3]WIV12175.1 YwmB family TATA-box binding protein [Proteiniborus sp. MB09-C3]
MKIIKGMLSIGLIVILAFINSAYAEKTNLNDEELFIKAFEETGADFSSLNLNFSGIVNELYKDEEQLRSMKKHIIKELGLIEQKADYSIENEGHMSSHSETFDSLQLVMYGKDKYDNQVTVILYSYFEREKNSRETSIVIDIIMDDDYAEIAEIRRKIDNLCKVYNIKTEITYCIIGTFEAELNKDNIIKKITKILSATNSKKVEGLLGDDIVSISAYSPNLDRTIYTGNKKMNLNIALSYNEYEGKTYITMGYPIITIGY